MGQLRGQLIHSRPIEGNMLYAKLNITIGTYSNTENAVLLMVIPHLQIYIIGLTNI